MLSIPAVYSSTREQRKDMTVVDYKDHSPLFAQTDSLFPEDRRHIDARNTPAENFFCK